VGVSFAASRAGPPQTAESIAKTLSSKPLRWLLAILLVAGCAATAPVQEMSDARQAIRAAESVGPTASGSADLHEAKLLMESAESALAGGRYGEARRLAGDARSLAIRARERSAADVNP